MERKAQKQFKGLFDKKPGEISDVGTDEREEEPASENPKTRDQEQSDEDEEETKDASNAGPRTSLFSLFWPAGRRIVTALGLDRCSIL